jgi:hypothetical protein
MELVENLPGTEEAGTNDMRPGTLVPLWEGEDLALHTTLLEELEAARIRYFDRPIGIFPGVRRWDPFPIQPMTGFGYQVAVLSADLPSAEKILERLRMEKPRDIDLPVSEERRSETTERVADPGEETTCEIWRGRDESLAGFLQDALHESEILMRTEIHGAETRIYVRPRDERRAREIVREVVEGAPPE